ncbi:MAG TPA: DUF885 domain-containing protein [Candidatus Polarisedimenticolia bacterium]|nr:DUF885 domain-containing protein [Candidatus Polarisedimenticolia bacterium]
MIRRRGAATVLLLLAMAPPAAGAAEPAELPLTPARLRELAHDHHAWWYGEFPVAATDAGRHDGDGRLADHSPAARQERLRRLEPLERLVASAATAAWPVDDRVDREVFLAGLRRALFEEKVLRRWSRDPGFYVEECANAIFSLLKREYAPRPRRARAALSRLRAMPALLATARSNLQEGVPLLARLAGESIDSIAPLFNDSLGILLADLSDAERIELAAARDAALASLRDFGVWLKSARKGMKGPLAIGRDAYERMLRDVHLLPLDAAALTAIGEVELARARALEAMLPDPTLADTLPPAGGASASGAAYRALYEEHTAQLIEHIKTKDLLTLPGYVGPFQILELPAAFGPTSPGGFMNPPGIFDQDPAGFYFLPRLDPGSGNFYVRAALSNPLPILGHEGIPGHFLQLSIANHNTSEIRRLHQDGVFVEGWALYAEEMLMRTGLYDTPGQAAAGEAGKAQVLRLMRYRAARIPVDVRLATGEWTFDQAVAYFMEEGGLDRVAATGEAAGAAVSPGQKMTYMVGKHQIQQLLGRYRQKKGAAFRLRDFHDELLAAGSLPLSLVEWLLVGDDTSFRSASLP